MKEKSKGLNLGRPNLPVLFFCPIGCGTVYNVETNQARDFGGLGNSFRKWQRPRYRFFVSIHFLYSEASSLTRTAHHQSAQGLFQLLNRPFDIIWRRNRDDFDIPEKTQISTSCFASLDRCDNIRLSRIRCRYNRLSFQRLSGRFNGFDTVISGIASPAVFHADNFMMTFLFSLPPLHPEEPFAEFFQLLIWAIHLGIRPASGLYTAPAFPCRNV